jgi:hypothetical protein
MTSSSTPAASGSKKSDSAAAQSNSSKTGMSPDAWLALLQRGKEYGLNLLISGPWTAIDEKYTDLDARMGGDRCQETAVLCMIIGSTIVNALEQRGMDDLAKDAIAKYRGEHDTNKPWQEVRAVEDVNSGKVNSPAYTKLMEAVHEIIGEDKAEFIGWAYTITSFSVLSNSEGGLPIKYRRKGEVCVQTTQTQRGAGMGVHYDAEFPLRSKFSIRQCDLMLDLCNQLVPDGVQPPAFGVAPEKRDTYLEQLREVFHFSRCEKINEGHPEYPITVASFSASGEILIKAAYKFGLVIVLDLPRFAYDKPGGSTVDEPAECTDVEGEAARAERENVDDTSSVTYKVRNIFTVTYIPDRTNGSYKSVDFPPDEFKDNPVWKLGGYSMYRNGGTGSGLSSCDDAAFEATLRKTDVGHMLSIFNFFHNEFPAGVKLQINVLDMMKTVCGKSTNMLDRTLERSIGWTLEADQAANPANLLEVMNASASIAREHDLFDTVFARQLNQQARSCFTATAKNITFTFNHIDISTTRFEQTFWSNLLSLHVENDITMYQHLFTIGNQLFSTANKTKADAWMKVNNANKVMDEYLTLHPDHLSLFAEGAQLRHKERQAAKLKKEAKKARHALGGKKGKK